MMKIIVALALVASVSAASTLRFQETGKSSCRIEQDGGILKSGCGKDALKPLITDTSKFASTFELDMIRHNINELYAHVPCRPGYFRPTTNPFVSEDDAYKKVCMVCPGDTYTTIFNFAGTCDACPTGYKHDDEHDHTYCNVCAQGYGFNGGKVGATHDFCSACPANQYQSGKDRDKCSSCPTNTHTGGKNKQGACTMCAAGYQRTGFTLDGHAVCSACTLGLTYATTSMQDCEGLSGCAKGKGARPSLSYYSTASDTPSRYCHDCSANTVYSKYDDLSACQDHDPCPAGQGVKNIGSVSDIKHRTCETCSGSRYSSSNAFHRCWTKTAAYSKTSSTSSPLQCANNYYSSGKIAYTASTGAKTATNTCHGCGSCSGQVKRACNTADGRGLTSATGSNTLCCTNSDKPGYATFTNDPYSSSGVWSLGSSDKGFGETCRYRCKGQGWGTWCNTCRGSGYRWNGSSCVKSVTYRHVRENQYCAWYNWGWAIYRRCHTCNVGSALNRCMNTAISRGHGGFFMNTNSVFARWRSFNCYTCRSMRYFRSSRSGGRGWSVYQVYRP